MVGETFRKHWEPEPWYPKPWPDYHTTGGPNISKQEFEDLKKEVALLKDLLKAAKAYDVKNNEQTARTTKKWRS